MNDPTILLAILAAGGTIIVWSCGDQARRLRDHVYGGAVLMLIYAEVAVALVGWLAVVAILVAAERAGAFWTFVALGARRALTWTGRHFLFPRRRVEKMTDRDWIGHVRRDAKAAAELAAAAEAAMRAMQETGGTPAERAGVLRIVGMARAGATNAVEQLEAVARREWLDSIGVRR